jgi:hypothetical protein
MHGGPRLRRPGDLNPMNSEPHAEESLRRLLHGEADAEDLAGLADRAATDPGFAARLSGELGFSEMLRQAFAPGDADAAPAFEAALDSAGLGGEEWLLRVKEGSASTYECDQVAKVLWEDPAGARDLRRRLAEDEWLHQSVAASKSEQAFIESLETRMWAETRRDHFVDDFAKRLEREIAATAPETPEAGKVIPFPRAFGTMVLKLGSAAAAVAMGAFLIGQLAALRYRDGGTRAPASLAKASTDATWEEGASPARDGTFRPGLYELKSGVVSLHLASGGEMIVEGPARFEVNEDASTNVHQGIALARLPDDESGPTLRSRGLSVSEPARLIGIDARTDESTEAVVFNGAGGICLTDSGKCRDLASFEAVKADHLRDRLIDVPYNPRAFSKAWEMLAGVEDNLGPVQIELPGSVISAAGGNEGEVRVFVENDSFRPESGLEVDRLVAGEFALAQPNPGQALESKGNLRSYLLQLTPSEKSGEDGAVETSLTFDHPVVGVIFSSDRLENSDVTVGSSLAEGGPEQGDRGLESGEDEILLSEDRRTLNLRFKGESDHAEQVRVLVALN